MALVAMLIIALSVFGSLQISKSITRKRAAEEVNKGEAFARNHDWQTAIKCYTEAIRLDPVGMADAHLRLAALYNARNLKEKAAVEYQEFLKQRPDYPEKKQLEAYILANKKRQ